MDSLTQSLMNGMCYGAAPLASLIYMKDSTSIRRLIISLKAMKSLEKIDFASIWCECKRDMGSKTSTLCPIHISCQMSLEISTLITRSLSLKTRRRIFGLLSQLTPHKGRAYILLMT
jgi:hypothetical protein